VLLLTYQVRLREPSFHLGVNLVRLMKAERVELVSLREELDSSEPWALQPAGEHDMTIDPAPPQRECRVAHPDLKGDPGLLG